MNVRVTEVCDTGTDSVHRRRASLAAPEGHSSLGFGQKVGALNKRGLHLIFIFWNTDCFPHHTDTDPTHLNVPFTVVLTPGGQAHGLLLGTSWRTEFDVTMRGPARLELTSAGQELDLYVLLCGGQAIATTDTALHTAHARWEKLSWLAHAGPQGLTGTLYEDDGDGHGPPRLTRL